MENLKKELQEKGYTFFKMQDYSEFQDEYNQYKKYICNSEKNLLNYIKSIRFDGNYLKEYIDKSILGNDPSHTRFHLDEKGKSFDDVHNRFVNEHLPKIDINESMQYWFYGLPDDILADFRNLSHKIVENLYDENLESSQHLITLTYYKKDCFLRQHRDGKTGTRLCAVLFYLNDTDYNSEWGGNIVFEGTESVEPIYGNVAVLDFKEGNCLHEVKKVIDGYGRYAILNFVSTGAHTNTQNYY